MPRKLTPEEEVEAQDFVDNDLVDDKEWGQHMHASKDFRKTKQELKDLEVWQRKVERGEIKKKKRKNDIDDIATMADVNMITQFDRDWTPEILEDILIGLRHPLDLHLYVDDFGGVEDAD
jgi:hypothetical protein